MHVFASSATVPVLAFILSLSACQDRPASPRRVDAGVSVKAFVVPVADGKKLAVDNCLMCHRKEMLEQQHLTSTQWAAVVKKMSGWGSPIEPNDVPALVVYLASNYGPDAGPYVPAKISAQEAAAELLPTEDGLFAGGDATLGRATYLSTCSTCHGPSARGQVGVNLVNRPILYRASDVAAMVREGRGRMLPIRGVTDAQLADILAYLRGLKGA